MSEPSAAIMDPASVASMSDEDLFALVPYDGSDLAKMEARTNPTYTAERLRVNEPVRYETIRRGIEQGLSIASIRRTNRCSNGLIYAIIDRMPGGREAYHAKVAGKLKDLAHICVDSLVETIADEKDPVKRAIVLGVAVDKYMALSGQPQLVVEHKVTIDQNQMEEYNAKLRAAREQLASMRQASGRVIEAEEVPAA